ncbi:MAG TPA: LppP/LprE family lipoprotein [Solirubrobacteraceae bacterium]|jgi:hypothetical protein|nr:LppP/LprE family lipoprotein [Solirubrobacteraceae bacterium]
MRRPPVIVLAAALAAGALAGCGSSNTADSINTETLTITRTTASTTSPATTPAAATTPTTTTTSTSTAATTVPPPTTTSSTRTETTAPAFVPPSSGGVSTAAAMLRSRGYSPVDLSQYHSSQTLQVLVGLRGGSGPEQAFFFEGARFIGTDTSTPSSSVSVVSQSDTSVTLSYGLSSGGTASVTYTLDNGQLQPQGPIPSVSERG